MSMDSEGVETPEVAGTPEDTNEAGSIAKATSVVGGTRIALIAIGGLWNALCAPFLGSEAVANVFNWANDRVTQFSQMWEKLLRPTVIPMFMHERRENGDQAAWQFASTVTNALVIVLAAVTSLGVLFSSQIADFLNKFEGEEAALSPEMFRWMVLALPFLSLAVMGYLLLNSYKRFGLAAVGDLVLKVMLVAGLVALFPFLGWPALVIAVVLGAVVKFALYIWGLRKEGVHYRPTLNLWTPAMKRFYIVMLPLLIGAVVALGRDYAEGYFRTGELEGKAASIVRYAHPWVDIPIQMLMLPLGIAIFPFITEAAARGRHRELFDGFFSICRGVLLIFIPMTVGMLFMRTALIQTLFEWHKFKASDTALTSEALFYYVFAFVPLALEIVILPYFYARRNTVTPTIAGVVASVLNVALLWWLLRETQLGVGAFTLAVVVTKALKVVVLIALLKQLFPEEHNWGHELGRVGDGLVRIALATAVMWGTMFVLSLGLTHFLDIHRKLGGLVYIGVISGAGFGSYLLMVVLLRVEEMRLMIGWVRQRIHK